MNNKLLSIALCIIVVAILKTFINKSNFNDYLIITLIASLVVKYILGDWDIGYAWTVSDIYYWFSLFLTSVVTIFLLNSYENLIKYLAAVILIILLV
jgi:hypothetical protein